MKQGPKLKRQDRFKVSAELSMKKQKELLPSQKSQPSSNSMEPLFVNSPLNRLKVANMTPQEISSFIFQFSSGSSDMQMMSNSEDYMLQKLRLEKASMDMCLELENITDSNEQIKPRTCGCK